MSRKKATLLTIKSLTAFSKVRSSTNSLISDKGHGLVRNLSIAAERSDFQNPNGSNGENLIDCQQNPRGFYSKTRNNVELKHSSDGYCEQSMYRGNTGENHQNPNEFNRGDTVVGFKEDPGVAFQHYPERKNVKLPSGDCRADSRNEFQGNPNGQFGYLSSSEKSSENVWQNTNPFYGGHASAHNSHGSHGQGQYGAQQHMDNRSYGSAPRFTGHANEQYGGNIGQFQGRGTEHYSGNAGVFQHNPDNYSARNTGMSQHSSDKYNSGSGITPQHYPGNNANKGGGYGQNQSWGDHHLADTGASQQVPQKNYLGNVGLTQHHPDNYGQGSTTTYQQGMCTPYVGSPNGYVMQNVEEGRHNASSGHYPNNSNESQAGITNFPLSNNVKSVVESVESAECYSGTIEELDDLCKEGKMKEVVELLELLEKKQILVPLPRCLMLMKACGEAKALKEAKFVHEYFMRSFTAPEVSSYNIILEMYGKCGTMDDAVEVFDKMPKRNLTSWDTMITCFAKNGLGEDAIELFSQFKQAGLKPDGQMFIGVLSACSVLGDINEGMLHFESMSKDYSIIPSMEHYVSVVDMLGSTGYLDEAMEFIEKMPVESSVEVWESLMNLSRVYGHVELGDRCAELVQLIDPTRLHDESKAGLIPVKASDIAKEKEKKKLAAENLLAVRSRVHEYRAGDTSHPEKDKIYALLRGMKEQLREAGYVAETRFVLHDIDQESKEDALLAHSERLAVAYGLMSSPARAPMRIIKNLRVCGDCHSALKIISKLVGRELIIRDAKRFHHFKDGLCSCRDYW